MAQHSQENRAARLSALLQFAVLLGLAANAEAQTIRIPLPELLGPQSITTLDNNSLPGPTSSVLVSQLPAGASFVGLEWSGTIQAGRVAGDGIERASIEQVLKGTFAAGLWASAASYAAFPTYELRATGTFQASWLWTQGPVGGFVDHNCLDCTYEPDQWTIGLHLIADWFALGNSIPFLQPPIDHELRSSSQGLNLVQPIEANISSAALVFESVPEPSCSMLLVVAGALMSSANRFRRRRAR